MHSRRRLNVVLSGALFASLLLLAISVVSMVKANSRLSEILDVRPQAVAPPSMQPGPSIDDQILSAQNKLRTASNRIRTRKVEIRTHASQAIRAIDERGEANLRDARRLLEDISENSKRILKRNEEIEAETLRLYSLYQRKIEIILEAKQAHKESRFGMSFWVGALGLLTTISGMIVAWRKDALDHQKDHRELLKLRHELSVQAV